MTDPDTSTAAPEGQTVPLDQLVNLGPDYDDSQPDATGEPDDDHGHPASCIDPLHRGDVPPDIDNIAFSKVLEFIGTGPAHFHVDWERLEHVDASPFPGWHYVLTLHVGSVCLGSVPDLSALDDAAVTQAEVWDMQRRGQAAELRDLGEALVGVAALIFGTVDRLHPSVAYRTMVRQGPGPEDDGPVETSE